MTIREKAGQGKALRTEVIHHMAEMLDSESPSADKPIMIGDAAILMAADGYGSGRVDGVEADKVVTIRTGEVQKSFMYQPDPSPEDLAARVHEELRRMNLERRLGHN